MYDTIPSNKSNELTSDAVEILKQIKKKADEISTSEGSIPILKNLTNPTNLTNPQIIGTQKSFIESTQPQSSYKKKIPLLKKRNIYKVKSQTDVLRNELFNDKKYLHYMLFKNEKNDKKDKMTLKNDDLNNFLDNNKGICITTRRKLKLQPIWEKLGQANTHVKEKNRRIDVRKFGITRKYIESSKNISQIKYNLNIKKEKYQELKTLQEAELLATKKTEEKVEQLQNYIENNYNKNYVQYLKFLNQTKEKEINSLYDLTNDITKLKIDIKKINNQISKLIENKCRILKWIELQIKLKERVKELPKFYFEIIEENDFYQVYPFKDILMKTKVFFLTDFTSLNSKRETTESQRFLISEESRNKITNYRYNLIFKTPEDFMIQYDNLQTKWLQNLTQHQKVVKEIDLIKNKYNENDISSFIEDERLALEKLNLLKSIYSQLNSQYKSLKDTNKKVIKKIQLDKSITRTKSVLSSPDIYSNIYNEMFNNLNFYTIKTSSSRKRKVSVNNELINYSNSNIYQLILDLFNIVKQNNFIKFDESNFIKNRNKNPIYEIFNYIEIIANLLFEEKNKYLNDPILRDRYKALQIICMKERKKLKVLKLIQINEFKRREKINIMNEKMNRKNYHPTKKIDFSLYKKLNKIKINNLKEKIKLKEEKKYEPNLEDFLSN